MRQLQVVGAEVLQWVEVPEPAIEEDTDVGVRPVAVTLCDLDRPMATGAFPLPLPIPFGHEFVTEIVDVGREVRR